MLEPALLAPRPRTAPISCAVVTVSDDKTEEADDSGTRAKELFHEAGYRVEFYRIVPDDGEKIRAVLLHLAGRVEVVVTSGGTGIARRDTTIEVAQRLIGKPLPGFGELFRTLSFETLGAAAMLTRATAGLYGREDGPIETLLFCCPGAVASVELALNRLILPDLRHLVWEAIRGPASEPTAVAPEPIGPIL